jgi:hypothetical protein
MAGMSEVRIESVRRLMRSHLITRLLHRVREGDRGALDELMPLVYFGGMTAEEIALVLARSVHVVRHELRLARAWLRRELAR